MRNTSIPTKVSKLYKTSTDNQTEVRVQIYQGESRLAEENDFLGDFVLSGLRPARRGEIAIRITFAIDTDGIVQVTAKNEETGEETDMLIEASSAMSNEEVESLRFDELDY